ncbi:MAG: FAD-dependent oxidoreductase [Catenulispora sp.]|nr:FAD-dependent oxidoreductase [Catenulispora sp.]
MEELEARSHRESEDRADICIIGAGIIGLHNAIQYAKRGFSVVIIDELTTRSVSRYKVGESLFGATNSFFRTVSDLDEAISGSFIKRGVWFAYGMEGKEQFGPDVAEWGFQGALPQRWIDRISDPGFARVMFEDAQIVRPEIEAVMRERLGKFENVTFNDRGLVRDVRFGPGEADHEVDWSSRDSGASGTVRARWVVDCSGRKRFLVNRLGHDVPLDDGFTTSAAWGQFESAFDPSDDRWDFVLGKDEVIRRDLDTVHLWGDGYWIWIIRLAGDRVSIGVSYDRSRPDHQGSAREVFWRIIGRYPLLEFVKGATTLDFSAYKSVQYISDTYVSADRYAISGDAASIIDAYYSQGMSLSAVYSWHAANIVERHLRDGVMDRGYIDHINRAAKADWLIMRGMVKYKYSPAIADSRFFILDHVVDYLVFAAFLPARFRTAQWLYQTGGYSSRETDPLKASRRKLERRLSLSQSAPWGRLNPVTVAKIIDRRRAGLAKRAQWRLDNGVRLRAATGVMRPDAAVPALWRLPYVNRMRNPNLSPKAFKEPAFLSPDLSGKLPPGLGIFGTILTPMVAAALAFDVGTTFLRRGTRAVTRPFRGRGSRA